MADLALKVLKDGSFDLDFVDNDLRVSDSLENAVLLSLGTYARERNLELNKANLMPVIGGWWADSLDSIGTLGGYLYEAYPGKLAEVTGERVKALADEALAWLKEEGVANSVECETKISGDVFNIAVDIKKPDGAAETFTYEINWVATYGI